MIAVRELTRAFDSGHGVFDLEFELGGGVVALVGENGAGKSTTFKLLTGMLRPTKGTIAILGRELWEGANLYELKRDIGYLPSEDYLVEELTGRENLEYCSYVRTGDRAAYRALAREIELLGAGRALDKPFRSCSAGERHKLQIIASLVTRPRILLWDEPGEGLDVASAAGLGEIMRTYDAPGRLLFLSSHRLELVEELCAEALILRDGRLVGRVAAPKRSELTAHLTRALLSAPAPERPAKSRGGARQRSRKSP